jgi:hypothetical protein
MKAVRIPAMHNEVEINTGLDEGKRSDLVNSPKAPPALWTALLPENSPANNNKKVISKKKNKADKAIEDRSEATKKIYIVAMTRARASQRGCAG